MPSSFLKYAVLLFVASIVSAGTCQAQLDYDQAQRQIEAYNQNMDQYMQQAYQAANQQRIDSQRQAINQYRSETGDYSSSDQVAYQRVHAKWAKENPEKYEYWQRQLAHTRSEGQQWLNHGEQLHQRRMADIQRGGETSRQLAQNGQDILDIGMRGHNQRMNSMDRQQNRMVDTTWEQSNFVNSESGERFQISSNQPNTYHSDGVNQFYTDGNYRQWQFVEGEWQKLKEFNR